MIKKIIILATGTYITTKLLNNKTKENTPYWYYFSVDTPEIIIKKRKAPLKIM